MSEAFVTLATNDTYAMGALVWAHSLRDTGTTRKLAIMTTPRGISGVVRAQLEKVFDHVEQVDVLDSGDAANLALLARPDLGVTFTKLHCWRLTRYEKAVFMDADTLVLQNVDELFEQDEFSGSPDPGWPDCFNSGVFVFRPSLDTYNQLLDFAVKYGSFDGGDQGILNSFFKQWHRLSFVYNCVAQSFYSYQPAFSHFRSQIRVVHFIGAVKPWHHSVNHANGQVIQKDGTGFSTEHLQRWWNLFFQYVLSTFISTSEFESQCSSTVPGAILHLTRQIRQSVLASSSRDGRDSRFSWFLSGRWFGCSGDEVEQQFSVKIHRTHVGGGAAAKGRSFFFDVAKASGSPRTQTRRRWAVEGTAAGGSSGSSSLSSASRPIVRYLITIGDETESHIDVVSPEQWHKMLRDEGILDDVEDKNFDEEFAWESYQTLDDGRLARLELPAADSAALPPVSGEERDRQYAWERNEIDYTGRDRFDNILDKINAAMHRDHPQ